MSDTTEDLFPPCGTRTREMLLSMPADMRVELHTKLHNVVVESPGTPWAEVCAALAFDCLAADLEDVGR